VWNKKQAGNVQRPSVMEEDYCGSQSPQQTVALENNNNNNINNNNNNNNNNNVYRSRIC
jgi:hypothetical protein